MLTIKADCVLGLNNLSADQMDWRLWGRGWAHTTQLRGMASTLRMPMQFKLGFSTLGARGDSRARHRLSYISSICIAMYKPLGKAAIAFARLSAVGRLQRPLAVKLRKRARHS